MPESPLARSVPRLAVAALLLAGVLLPAAPASGQGKQPDFIPSDYDDYQDMLTKLGIQ
jgi:hypothetical protein